MKIVYIAHAISGDVEANLSDLRRIIRKINLNLLNIVPFCPYYADVVSLDDTVPEERKRGMANDIAVIETGFCEECWLTGEFISEGMREEEERFNKKGIPVIDKIGQL